MAKNGLLKTRPNIFPFLLQGFSVRIAPCLLLHAAPIIVPLTLFLEPSTHPVDPTTFIAKRGRSCTLLSPCQLASFTSLRHPLGAGLFFVDKKDKILRACINYCTLNKIIIKNNYPLALLSSAFKPLHRATIFSKLDLRNA